MRANYRRIALSIYLDYVLIYGLTELFLFFAGFDIVYSAPVAVLVTLFARAVLHGAVASPGMHMLSMDAQYSVDEEVKARESWLTMLVGVLMVRESIEQAVRWIDMPVPEPFFGVIPGMQVDMVIALAEAPLGIATGWLILRLSRVGLWLGIALGLADVCSTILSWNLYDNLVPFWVRYWSQGRGSTPRGGEIEFLQSIVPEAFLVVIFLVMAALVLSWRKFAPSAP